MNLRNHIYAAVVLVAALLCSCTRPDQTETYVGVRHRNADGMYSMTVDMSDSLASYDFTIFTRLDLRKSRFETLEDSIGVGAEWMAPDSTRYREFFYIPKDSFSSSTSFSKDYFLPYRRGVVPNLPGVWTVSFLVMGEAAEYMNGMGLICKTNRE